MADPTDHRAQADVRGEPERPKSEGEKVIDWLLARGKIRPEQAATASVCRLPDGY